MSVKTKLLVAGVLSTLSAGVFAADSSVSFNAAVTSDYRFRGVSQSAKDPAVQGGVDYTSGGVYLGAWASTIDFDPIDGNLELDLYGGFKFNAGGIDWDVGAIYYGYPGSDGDAELPFTELYFGGTVGPAFAKFYYSDDFTGTTEDSAYYITAGANLDIGNGIMLGLSIGQSDGDAFAEGYTDYKVGASKEFGGFGFNLSYVDTDIDPEVEDDVGNSEGVVVLTVSKTF